VSRAITSLRIAIAETPRRAGIGTSLAAAVAETIRQSVAAVRACDSGITALVTLLAEKSTPVPAPGSRTAGSRPSPSPAGPVRALRGAEAFREQGIPRSSRSPSPAQEPVTASPATGYSYSGMAATPASHRSPEPPSPREAMPPREPLPPREAIPPIAARSAELPPVGLPPSGFPSTGLPPSGLAASGLPRRSDRYAEERRSTGPVPEQPRLSPNVPAPGSRNDWPLNGNSLSDQAVTNPGLPSPTPAQAPAPANGRVTPPWQADDLPAEPPTLRLVEPDRLTRRAERDPLTDPVPPTDTFAGAPSLRLVNPDPIGTTALDDPISPNSDEDDSDLLIFAQTRSAWFTGHAERAGETPEWSNAADLGWQAAERASSPVFGDETEAGLPRRVPAANLVPGSPLPPAERPLRIVRDPAAMAQHTTGYFRGSRRGEEVRGFALGGRPGREAASGWDFSRDGDGYEGDGPDGGYEYRSAARR
jgi:hypothetical protein